MDSLELHKSCEDDLNDKDDENINALEEEDRDYQDNLQKMFDLNGEL